MPTGDNMSSVVIDTLPQEWEEYEREWEWEEYERFEREEAQEIEKLEQSFSGRGTRARAHFREVYASGSRRYDRRMMRKDRRPHYVGEDVILPERRYKGRQWEKSHRTRKLAF